MRRQAAIASVLMLAGLTPAYGWGREGHEVIAKIAERYLTKEARMQVARLLQPGETMASVAPWADEVRPGRRETGTWHYINVPLKAAEGDWRAYCPKTGCVAGVIPKLQETLRSSTANRAEKADALKFLIHFVGDLHQPLHTGDNGDRGGNDVQVVFRNRPGNLHSLWDTGLLYWAFDTTPGLKAGLPRGPGFWARRSMRKGTLDNWVWETRDVSRDVAYRNLPQARPAQLGDDYAAKARPALERQIQRAGVRLARLLNETFTD